MQVKLAVTIAGALLIVLVNWYFFFSRRKETSDAVEESGLQEVNVNVKGGYRAKNADYIKKKNQQTK